METKKYASADLSAHFNLFFAIGLVFSLSLTWLAFEWKSYEKPLVEMISKGPISVDDFIEVPPTEITPPPPVLQQPRLLEIPDAEEIKEEVQFVIDAEITEGMKMQEVVVEEKIVIEREEADIIFTVVENGAVPKDGFSAFYGYVANNIKYPAAAKRMNVQGKVFVEFVVEKDGSLTSIQTIKGIGAGCDEEAERIIRNSPVWSPARQRGKAVRQRMVLPITFKMAER